jgi:hypothetical protein
MNSIDFCYWLQGCFELADVKQLDENQVNMIKAHLNLVFKHEIDPMSDNNDPVLNQTLANIHNGSAWTPPNDPLVRC